jgi:plastocyanin
MIALNAGPVKFQPPVPCGWPDAIHGIPVHEWCSRFLDAAPGGEDERPERAGDYREAEEAPAERLAEVGDFIDFLWTREAEHQLTRVAAKPSEAAFARVWDNEADAEYDRL